MKIIGANINSSEDTVDSIIDERDQSSLLKMAEEQIYWGATMLAINCGTRIDSEPTDIEWMARTIQDRFEIPLCFDSPNPAAHRAGLSIHRHGRAMIDSITGEEERMNGILPLVRDHHAMVTALLHDESGMPETVEDRLRVIPDIIGRCESYGIRAEDTYLDAMVFPMATSDSNPQLYLETLSIIRRDYPEYGTICGLNNISYGMPIEDVLNSTFLTMCAQAGQHAAYVKLSDQMCRTAIGISSLKGEDPFCIGYLQAYREGKLE